jgi:hypothetical protein
MALSGISKSCDRLGQRVGHCLRELRKKRRPLTANGLRTGRVTTRFYGDPEDCWGQFAGPTVRRAQFVRSWR